jgi:hypothetical protein
MKNLIVFLFLLLAFNSILSAQRKKDSISMALQVNRLKLDTLKQKLSGVRYVDLGFSRFQEERLVNNPNSLSGNLLEGFTDYANDYLRLDVIWTAHQRADARRISKSTCDYTFAEYKLGKFKSLFGAIGEYPLSLTFRFCDHSTYTLNTKVRVTGLTENYLLKFKGAFINQLSFDRKYDAGKKLNVYKCEPVISESRFRNYLDSNAHLTEFEGMYELSVANYFTSKYTVGILNSGDSLSIIYFKGADYADDWVEGEVRGKLYKTGSENDFIADWLLIDKSVIKGSIHFIDRSSFEFNANNDQEVLKFVRVK